MTISCIVAAAENNAIGLDNDLPWHLPGDLKFFKETTKSHFVIMGRKSFESIGKPLPGRTNIVITTKKDFSHSGLIVVHSITDALQYALDAEQDEVFILGGAMIYKQTQNLWNKLYLTRVHTRIENATAYFPNIDFSQWDLEWEKHNPADEKNKYSYSFQVYSR